MYINLKDSNHRNICVLMKMTNLRDFQPAAGKLHFVQNDNNNG